MRTRIGTTILEVLFATGIVIVGLIGIASILPIAIRNSTQSNTSAEGLSLGLAWADSFLVRGLHQPTAHSNQGQFTWVWNLDDPNNWRAYEDLSPKPTGNYLGAANYRTPWKHVAVCIDPNLETDYSPTAIYRPSVFPYFQDNLPDSSNDPQPRMLRVSLANRASAASPVSPQVIKNLFSSVDELIGDTYVDPNSTDASQTAPDRDTLPAKRQFRLSPSGEPLRSLTSGQYTWMATITRQEPVLDDISTQLKAEVTANTQPEHGLITLLVLHRHDHRLNVNPDTPSASGERLVRVIPLSGDFKGGAGGRVRLESNVATSASDQIAVGDWIMLGRYYLEDRSVSPSWRYAFFRWYRIIGLSSEPLLTASGDWTREVVLEGPDFVFGPTLTYGTLLGGVVTVVERQVKLQ